MKYFRTQRRKRMADHATRDLPPYVMECTRTAMLLTFTDEQLEHEYVFEKYRYSRSRRLQNKVDAVLLDDGRDKFKEVSERISELIGNYCDQGHAPAYLFRLKTLAAAIDRVKIKYGDSSKAGYRTAMDSGAETALAIQTALKYPSRRDSKEVFITPAQEEGLVAVMFLLRQSGGDGFYPSFDSEDTSVDRWLTERTLASPEDVEGNVAAFRSRRDRWREIEAKVSTGGFRMRDDNDVLCDYPDELLDRLAQIAEDDFRLWEELERYVITVHGGNSHHTMNEVLHFMGPYRTQFNIRYLAGTIPSVLRAYKCLPPMDDYSSAPGVRDQCEALLRISITSSMKLRGGDQSRFLNDDRTIKDQRLIDLLMVHPERAEEIANVIEERQTADFDLINDITSSVMGEGML